MSAQAVWDVIVIGAGPAGSTTAALLAQAGVRVLVLEKDEFPRFHVGESLLPASSLIHQLLGVEPVSEIFQYKRGAQFVCERTGRVAAFDFNEALPGPPRHAYHVERASFDRLLRDRARKLGAEIRHGVRVHGVGFDPSHVEVQTRTGSERARFVVDATGQDRLFGKQQRSIEPFRHFGKAASFTHFEGLSQATQQEFAPANDIRIMIVEDGWAWVIPLPGARLSVGLVSRSRGELSRDEVMRYVKSSPSLSRWVLGASPTQSHLIGNFSFRNTKSSGSRFACVGDSACFIDPVFSSGVSLAIVGAFQLVERLLPALATGSEGAADLLDPVHARMAPAYDTFASLVYRFYNTRFIETFLFNAPEQSPLRPGVVSVLAGDVMRDDNPFQQMLLNGRRQPWRDAPSSALSPATRRGQGAPSC